MFWGVPFIRYSRRFYSGDGTFVSPVWSFRKFRKFSSGDGPIVSPGWGIPLFRYTVFSGVDCVRWLWFTSIRSAFLLREWAVFVPYLGVSNISVDVITPEMDRTYHLEFVLFR